MLKFITGNKNKFEEVAAALAPVKIEQVKIDLDEIQDLDPHNIIRHKLKAAFKHHSAEFIIEDVSLFLDCLGGKLPGPLVKWFNVTVKDEGIYKITRAMRESGATVKVILAYAKNPKEVVFFESTVKGNIVKPKGKGSFGFDPVFKPRGSNKTLADLKAENNFSFSPRVKAIIKLKKYLEKMPKTTLKIG